VGKSMTNQGIAAVLEQTADRLEAQKANPHWVRAYRSGTNRVRSMETCVAAVKVLDTNTLRRVFDGLKEVLRVAIAKQAKPRRHGGGAAVPATVEETGADRRVAGRCSSMRTGPSQSVS
jgi:DNA polymerase/3'-5' exonuclease PolX